MMRNRFSIDYEKVFRSQGGVCAICSDPPKEGGNRLHMDHDHKFHKFKIRVKKRNGLWYASVEWPVEEPVTNAVRRFIRLTKVYPSYAQGGFTKRKAAKKMLQRIIRNASFRGLLCWFCNTALQKFRDDPVRMEASARYIRRYQGELV